MRKYVLRDRARCAKRTQPVLMTMHVTEKGSMVYEKNVILFEIHDLKATKFEIARTVTEQLKTTPVSVNTMVRKGKNRRVRGVTGRRSDRKFAYVTLAKDFQMPEIESP